MLNGNDLYASVYNGGRVVKINTTSATPTSINVISNLYHVFGLLLDGNDLYIADNANRISKTDISATTPTLTLVQDGLRYPVGLLKYDGELYFSELLGGINKLNSVTLSINSNPKINVAIFPNPAQDMLYIKGINQDMPYIISSVTGTVLIKGITNNELHIDALSPGIYILQLGTSIHKFIKK